MKNKGQIGTFIPFIFIGIVVVFIFAIVVIPIAEVGDQTFDALKKLDQVNNSNTTEAKIDQVQNLVTPAFDQLVFVILIAIILGTIAIAIFTDYHPVVLGVMILAIIFLVLISGLFVNVDDELKDNSIIANKSTEFTFRNAIMGKQLPIIIGFIGIVSIIVLLAKRGNATAPI